VVEGPRRKWSYGDLQRWSALLHEEIDGVDFGQRAIVSSALAYRRGPRGDFTITKYQCKRYAIRICTMDA
jgi:hypothetical protein